MSLIEAAACGCAIVTPSTCGIPNYFEHNENAMLFPPWKPELGRKYINELLEDDDKAKELGMRAREMIKKRCDLMRFTDQWENLLSNVLN